MQTPNLQPKSGIDIKQTTELKCEECDHHIFTEGFMIRKASKLLTGAVNDTIIPIPVMMCAKCGHVNNIFKPKEL